MHLHQRTEPSRLMAYLSPLIAVALTLLCGAFLFHFLGLPADSVLIDFFISPLRDIYGVSELLLKASPLIICAAGLCLCYRANIWNIGAEGQFVIGALIAGAVALQFNNPDQLTDRALGLPMAILGGCLGGAAWAGIAALLRIRFNCNEILTTIMLNYIAINALMWAVQGPLKDPMGFSFPESALFADHLFLPVLHSDYRTNIALFFGLISLGALWVMFAKTMQGFQVSTLGESKRAASYAGFKTNRLTLIALCGCGLLAGLAGAAEVTGTVGQVTPYIPQGYGYSAIIVVFLGRLHPAGILFAALLMALTFLGGENLQIEYGLPKSISLLFQGMLLFFLLVTNTLISNRLVFQTHQALAN